MELTHLLPKTPLLLFPKHPSSYAKTLCCIRASLPGIPPRPLSISFAGSVPRSSPSPSIRSRFASISSSAAAYPGGGGGDGLAGGAGGGGGGGGGEGGSEGAAAEAKALAAESDEASDLRSGDVIVLHVGGMSCGGCAASVKRILEGQRDVSSATVYLEKETAIVLPIAEAKVTQDWRQQLGEKLANHLTTCGFKSHPQAQGHATKAADQP
uniref:HMA domain-containing protein n=1 Tax=Ananas comosus var. bracteatus TaxID=296719 RepID=A0A6V7QQR7_ANACO